jgi:hypothetical protein
MSREIIVDDSLNYLSRVAVLPNVVTGICDLDEIDMTMPDYLQFFKDIASLIFKKLDKQGYAIFIQTDRKFEGAWFDKSYMLTSIAMSYGCKLVWHKIVLHRDVDHTDLHRPCYAHMLCYTYTGKPGAAFPDVLPVSKKMYKNGTPLGAAKAAINFIRQNNKRNTKIVDPFVGQGTIVAVANSYGLDAIGIDIDPKQADLARGLQLLDTI